MATAPPKYLHVRLEGAFCVVIKKNDGYRVRACTIADSDHLFAINGEPIKDMKGKSFHFQLKPDGLETYTKWPDIDPAFDWSNETTADWDNNDSYYFITMDLPCPKQIRQDCTARVTFEDDSEGLMPQDHILGYEIKDPKKLQITCRELGPQKIDDNGNFTLEIGLPLDSSPGQVHDRAIMFYNKMLRKLFPTLSEDDSCVLNDIDISEPGIHIVTTTYDARVAA
jgi:hypothetical protein